VGKRSEKSTTRSCERFLACSAASLAEAGRRAGVSDMTVANWRDRFIERARYMQGHPLSIPVMARGYQGGDSLP